MKTKKSLRYKILFVVLPLFLISFAFLGITTYFSINKSITNIAKEFIGYKLKEISEFSVTLSGQSSTNINTNVEMFTYAQKFQTETFIIIPYDFENIQNTPFTYTLNSNVFSQDSISNLYTIVKKQDSIRNTDPNRYNSWIEFTYSESEKYVGLFIPNTALNSWLILLEKESLFYSPVIATMSYLIIIAIISLIVLTILILFFVNFLTTPMNYCVNTIKSITDSMDFSKRVRIFYPDEIGVLGYYFNNLVQELEKSYNQIKNYAYQTVKAKQKEERIRFIFQKYVPSDVIDQVLHRSTDSILVGTKQNISVLFSDIRDFTTISESLAPEELVLSLNKYFTIMVQEIINNKGIIDKFIGDSIMAIFGAPVVRETNADEAVDSALQMVHSLEYFNKMQLEDGKITFAVGIGINTGDTVVGNIGSEQKLEYTVIGDVVNLGARLEGLTKYYGVPVLISEFTKNSIQNQGKYFFINVDTVRVKGKKFPVVIYTVKIRSDIDSQENSFYNYYHVAQQYYYTGDFHKAYENFIKLKDSPYMKTLISLYIERCLYLKENPPVQWDGVENWKTK